MKVVARARGHDPRLLEVCAQLGLRTKRVPAAVIVDLPLVGTAPFVYKVPPPLADAVLLVEEEECGGAGYHVGSATVVAGLGGGRMKPFHVLQKKGMTSRVLFAAPEGLLVAKATWSGGPVFGHVEEVTLEQVGDRAHLLRKMVWRGNAQDSAAPYGEMVHAVADRAQCPYCEHVHYGR